MDIYTTEVNADKMLYIIMACNQRKVIKAIWMKTGLFLRRLCGTNHDTKDVSKTTDTQYSAVLLYPYLLLWIMYPDCFLLGCAHWSSSDKQFFIRPGPNLRHIKGNQMHCTASS